MKKGGYNYRREGATYLIELKLNSIQQLFNSLDPAPFRDKDLDPEAHEYIVESAAELPRDAALKLVIHLGSESSCDERVAGVPEAIRNYFTYRAEVMGRQFSRVLEQGRKALVIGLCFLIFCIFAQQLIAGMGKAGIFWSIVEEGFLISGWVAMWHPINLFLYEWWPIRRRQRLFEKLSRMPVELSDGGAV